MLKWKQTKVNGLKNTKGLWNAYAILKIGGENILASGHKLLLLLSMEGNILDYENWQW